METEIFEAYRQDLPLLDVSHRHMRQRLVPMLFDDTDSEAAEALRTSVVVQAQRSAAAVKSRRLA